MQPVRATRTSDFVLRLASWRVAPLRCRGDCCLRRLPLRAETDLDAFMRQVLARRDDNWKKLQQYILDEREQIELRGPNLQPIWGERREYTWYIRDGLFVRSPVRFNGVEIGEAERRKYEAEFLQTEPRSASGARQRQAGDLRALPAARLRRRVRRQSRERRRAAPAGARAAVRLVGVFPPVQVRGRHLRAGRARDARRPRRGARRILPVQPVFRSAAPPHGARPQSARSQGRRDSADDEQGRARHAVDRARRASDRQVHLRQHRLRFPPGAVARAARQRARDDDDEPAVSRTCGCRATSSSSSMLRSRPAASTSAGASSTATTGRRT